MKKLKKLVTQLKMNIYLEYMQKKFYLCRRKQKETYEPDDELYFLRVLSACLPAEWYRQPADGACALVQWFYLSPTLHVIFL